jgi:hypothetical protein
VPWGLDQTFVGTVRGTIAAMVASMLGILKTGGNIAAGSELSARRLAFVLEDARVSWCWPEIFGGWCAGLDQEAARKGGSLRG